MRDCSRIQDSTRGRSCRDRSDSYRDRCDPLRQNKTRDVSRDAGRWENYNGGSDRNCRNKGFIERNRSGQNSREEQRSPHKYRGLQGISSNSPWRRREASPTLKQDRTEHYSPQRSVPASLSRLDVGSSKPTGRDDCCEEGQPSSEADNGARTPYFDASVVDGVPRADKRPTWRAEIFLPRPGVQLAHRDRGSVCIRGPNRFSMEEAEDDLAQCKEVAEQAGPDAAKQVRALASRLKTDFERKKHIDSGHAAKET